MVLNFFSACFCYNLPYFCIDHLFYLNRLQGVSYAEGLSTDALCNLLYSDKQARSLQVCAYKVFRAGLFLGRDADSICVCVAESCFLLIVRSPLLR